MPFSGLATGQAVQGPLRAVERRGSAGPGSASEPADEKGVGHNDPIRPECPGVERNRNAFVRRSQGENHQMVADVILVGGGGEVVPMSGEHRQQLTGFMLGEIKDPEGGFEFVPPGWEALTVDCTSACRRAGDDPCPLQR